jgi:hypothetical protein
MKKTNIPFKYCVDSCGYGIWCKAGLSRLLLHGLDTLLSIQTIDLVLMLLKRSTESSCVDGNGGWGDLDVEVCLMEVLKL